MREKIDCFLPQGDAKVMEEMAVQLRKNKAVQNVIMMETGLMSSNALMQVAENAKADYVLLLTKPVMVSLGQGALDRMLRVASDSNAVMVYSDYISKKEVDGRMALLAEAIIERFALDMIRIHHHCIRVAGHTEHPVECPLP